MPKKSTVPEKVTASKTDFKPRSVRYMGKIVEIKGKSITVDIRGKMVGWYGLKFSKRKLPFKPQLYGRFPLQVRLGAQREVKSFQIVSGALLKPGKPPRKLKSKMPEPPKDYNDPVQLAQYRMALRKRFRLPEPAEAAMA